jgi:hypothetical protein
MPTRPLGIAAVEAPIPIHVDVPPQLQAIRRNLINFFFTWFQSNQVWMPILLVIV